MPGPAVPLELERSIGRVAVVGETAPETEARRLAEDARDRVRFEEEALELADQVYRVARRLVSSREEAEDLMQETYARAFRSWKSFQPGTNLRAWLLRILTNLNIDRGRRIQRAPDMQPLEEGDYFLYNRLEEATKEPNPDEARVIERLSAAAAVAEEHLDLCDYCRKRYRFEAVLRRFVRQAVSEEMPPELKTKLSELRTPLL